MRRYQEGTLATTTPTLLRAFTAASFGNAPLPVAADSNAKASGALKPPPSPLFKHSALSSTSGEVAGSLTGTIVVWSPVDRKGIIETTDSASGKAKWFRILSPRAFETLVPPHVRDLTGATVKAFTPVVATDGSHEPVRIYNKLVRPVFVQPVPLVAHKDLLGTTERSMQRRAHQVNLSANIDRLEAIAFDKGIMQGEGGALLEEMKRKGSPTEEDDDELDGDVIPSNTDSLDIATQIIVDLSTAKLPKGQELVGLKARDYFEGGMRPSPGVKDLRNKTLFTMEELALVKARQEVGNAPHTTGSEQADTESIATLKLAEMRKDESDVEAYHKASGDLSSLGIRKIVPQRELTFKFGADANEWRPPTSSTSPASAKAGNTVLRTVHKRKAMGKVIAWSALHRSGMLVSYDPAKAEEENKALEDSLDASLANGFIVRNVDAFSSAMPTAVALHGRLVEFTSVSYSDDANPNMRYAEEITILGAPTDFRLSDPEARKAFKDKEREEMRHKAAKKNYIVDSVVRPKEAPTGNVFGVVTRWSGGQGAVEAANGVTYYINSPTAFSNVADTSQPSAIRGAVVRFRVNQESPEYALEVEMLSSSAPKQSAAAGSPADIQTVEATAPVPVDNTPLKPAEIAPKLRPATGASGSDVTGSEPSQRFTPMCSGDIPLDDPRWITGFIVILSTTEGQGVIQALAKKHEDITVTDERGLRRLKHHQLGDRYLLRDFATNVVNYDGANRVMIKKGRKVRFIAQGTSGRMASLVTPTDLTLTDEEVRVLETEEKARGEELERTLSASEEALPGPTSGLYWMERLEQAGFDMTEMRSMKGDGSAALDPNAQSQKRAQTMGLDDEDLKSDSFDPIAVMESDPWFKDKSKNIKIPGSDMRLGDVQKLSPSSMMGLATKVKDPVTLQKTKDKYYNRLTEPQKEWAWNQAKEQAPLYEKRMKEARLKGEEPKFTFF